MPMLPTHSLLCFQKKENTMWMSEMEYKLLHMYINPSALGKVLPQLVPDGFVYLRYPGG